MHKQHRGVSFSSEGLSQPAEPPHLAFPHSHPTRTALPRLQATQTSRILALSCASRRHCFKTLGFKDDCRASLSKAHNLFMGSFLHSRAFSARPSVRERSKQNNIVEENTKL
ncbi:hypothetical protein E2C01_000828 [Portunus trituberculatus]|uniref:Uncharacterized protein n=1 Tax=Portunus trituberculatus TaxID=210409 RepID=A0A5B7CG37_PORTR|nr:hypothetical protein [Portunus trituberculatus]